MFVGRLGPGFESRSDKKIWKERLGKEFEILFSPSTNDALKMVKEKKINMVISDILRTKEDIPAVSFLKRVNEIKPKTHLLLVNSNFVFLKNAASVKKKLGEVPFISDRTGLFTKIKEKIFSLKENPWRKPKKIEFPMELKPLLHLGIGKKPLASIKLIKEYKKHPAVLKMIKRGWVPPPKQRTEIMKRLKKEMQNKAYSKRDKEKLLNAYHKLEKATQKRTKPQRKTLKNKRRPR